MDLYLLSQLEQTLSGLHTPVSILDSEGNSLIPNEDIRFTLPTLGQEAVTIEGRTYQVCSSNPDLVMMVQTLDQNNAEDILRLADAMIKASFAANAASNDLSNAYQRLLQNELSLGETDAMIEEYHIPKEMPRSVLMIHMIHVQQRSASDILSEVLPTTPSDVVIGLDKHTAVLIKDATGISDIEEIRQFAMAAQQTVLDETGISVTIGIGDIADDLSDLHSSFRQARRAIEIGRIYREEDSIYVYRFLMLERFMSDLPQDTAMHYHNLLFNRSTTRLFSDEMLYTIEMFFKKDLNLSDTARQLYIHRNTLVYRLDKVQRQVGLDLRKFEDAVTFKILLEMKKCGTSIKKTKKK